MVVWFLLRQGWICSSVLSDFVTNETLRIRGSIAVSNDVNADNHKLKEVINVDDDIGLDKSRRGILTFPSPNEFTWCAWAGVATGDPRSFGRPPIWRTTVKSDTIPYHGVDPHRHIKQHSAGVAKLPSGLLADRCPTCSADLELRDRTYDMILSACPFCDTERPRQAEVSLGEMHLDWVPPIRVPTSILLPNDSVAKQHLRPLPSPDFETRFLYEQRAYPGYDVSAFNPLEDPWKPTQLPQASVNFPISDVPSIDRTSQGSSRFPSETLGSFRQRPYIACNVCEADVLEEPWPPEDNWKKPMALRNEAKISRRGLQRPSKAIQAIELEMYVPTLIKAEAR